MRKSNNHNYKKKKKKKKKKDKGEELVPRSKIKKYVHDLNNYPSPDIFQNKYNEKSVLIIGTGPSSNSLLKYKEIVRKKFEVIIGVNFSVMDFEDILDFHVIMEKGPTKISTWMNGNAECRKDLPRVFSSRCIQLFDPRFKFVRAERGFLGEDFDPKVYDERGFLFAYEDLVNGATVMLQAVHFACMLGCNKIHLIGSELCFKEERYYFENPNHHNLAIHKSIYRDLKIIKIEHKGEEYYSLKPYMGSAACINKFITDKCAPLNIKVFDFSDGLIVNAEQINIDDFMEKET